MRIERDAGVFVGEGLFGVIVHQNATFAFFEAAVPRRLGIGRYGDRADAEQAGIEAMFGIRIFRQHHVSFGLLQAGEIGLAACDRVIVVGRAVVDPDRARHGLGVGGIAG